MRRPLMLLPLLLAGCSCQPDPPHADPVERGGPVTATATAAPQAHDSADDTAVAAAPERAASAVAEGAERPSEVVRAYVTSLSSANRSVSDGYWLHAPSAASAGDGALRALQDVRALRVASGRPVPRDNREPSELIEVPVEVRVETAQGRLHFRGWYRLVPDADRLVWKLQSASVQPVLD